MKDTHVEAENRYELIRRAALQATQEILQLDGVPLVVTGITSQALGISDTWGASSTRQVDWDWRRGYQKFKSVNPKRFEIALWSKSQLVSLSMGRPTYGGTGLRLDFIEASPRDITPDRPEVFEATALGYLVYAQMIAAKQIRIMHPINERVRAYYEQFGYTYVRNGDYLCMEVQ